MPDDNKKEVLEAEYVGDSTHEPARNYSYGQYNTYSGNGQRAGGARFTVFQFRDNRLDACRGDSGKSWVQAAKVPNSWSSRSFLSVSTTTVGFWKQCMILAV